VDSLVRSSFAFVREMDIYRLENNDIRERVSDNFKKSETIALSLNRQYFFI